jgi:hypothetical protein
MTSIRQIEANRRNALESTGPKTDQGKRRASQNAVRHGLTAETVIVPLEDIDDYKAFEQAVTADFEAVTAVERELVLRLASLLWRLRRATSIETGLLQIGGEIPHEPRRTTPTQPSQDRAATRIIRLGELPRIRSEDAGSEHRDDPDAIDSEGPIPASLTPNVRLDIARRFWRLADLDNGVFQRLGRYEASLWRQVRQTLFTLEGMRWRTSNTRRGRTRQSWQRPIAPPCETDW